jgi:hypothetical protein
LFLKPNKNVDKKLHTPKGKGMLLVIFQEMKHVHPQNFAFIEPLKRGEGDVT